MLASERAIKEYEDSQEQEYQFSLQRAMRFEQDARRELEVMFPDSSIKYVARKPLSCIFRVDNIQIRVTKEFYDFVFQVDGICSECGKECWSTTARNIVGIGELLVTFEASLDHRKEFHRTKPEYDAADQLVDALRELLGLE